MDICACSMVILGYQISSREPYILVQHIAMRNQSIKFTGIRNGYKILTLCIFTFFPLWAYAQSTTPAQEVLEFYQKYMINCDHMFSNGVEKNRDGLFCNMNIGKYITKELHNKIISAYNSGTYSNLTGDRNYFTHTQDFDARWASFMSVTEIKADRNNSVIRLLMNFPKGAGEPLAVCVRLHRESSVWKIYQVDPSLYTDLPDCRDN
ncbi:DUF3828 domain-containing protein [Acetobacter sp. DmW_136]|nr:DUF3828 domain-containing protein [Acetobacter sp. DmW_136]